MQSVLHSFSYGLDYLRELVADLDAEQMVQQPAGIRNHPAWVIGHLTVSCQLIGGDVGLDPWLPADWFARYGPGSTPVAVAGRYDSKEAVLAKLADAQSRIELGMMALSKDQLNGQFPTEAYRHLFPSLRHALVQVLVGHTAFHVGQISIWRKAASLPAVTRGFM